MTALPKQCKYVISLSATVTFNMTQQCYVLCAEPIRQNYFTVSQAACRKPSQRLQWRTGHKQQQHLAAQIMLLPLCFFLIKNSLSRCERYLHCGTRYYHDGHNFLLIGHLLHCLQFWTNIQQLCSGETAMSSLSSESLIPRISFKKEGDLRYLSSSLIVTNTMIWNSNMREPGVIAAMKL